MRILIVASIAAVLGAASCNPKASEPSGGDKAEKALQTQTATSFDEMPAVGTSARCPVMGGEFEVTKDTQWSKHDGRYYVFCCPGCKPKFDAEPGKYLK